jgi:hypothetical protein
MVHVLNDLDVMDSQMLDVGIMKNTGTHLLSNNFHKM